MGEYIQLVTLSSNLVQSVSRKGWLALALGWNTACSLFVPSWETVSLGLSELLLWFLSVPWVAACMLAGQRVYGQCRWE